MALLEPVIRSSLISLSWIIHGGFAAIDTRVCYLRNDEPNEEYRPCYSPDVKSISHCCDVSDTCTGNTLCLGQHGWLQIGGCTAQGWANGTNGIGDCPKYVNYCTDDYNILTLCAILTDGAEFCCGAEQGMNQCCSGRTFRMQNTTHEYLDQRPWDDDPLAVSTPSSSTSTTWPTDGQKPDMSAEASASTPLGLPIGLGVGLGVPLLIVSGLFYLAVRKRHKAEIMLPASEERMTSENGVIQLDAMYTHEVDAGRPAGAELYTHAPIAELPYRGYQL